MNPLVMFGYLWMTIAIGTFFFLGALVLSAFHHGGMAKFRLLNVGLPALATIVIIMSILFPIAWTLIYHLIKDKP